MEKKEIFRSMTLERFKKGIIKFLVDNQASKAKIRRLVRHDVVPLEVIEQLKSNGIIPKDSRTRVAEDVLNEIRTWR